MHLKKVDNKIKEKLISIQLNSNNPVKFKKFALSFFDNSENISALEIIVHIDKNDVAMLKVISDLNLKYDNGIKYVETDLVNDFNDLWKPINILHQKTSDSVKLMACLSDDFYVKTKNWDKLILNNCENNYVRDQVFRIRCFKNRSEKYNNIWECIYKPDASFYSKVWIDTVGYWNLCIGPDTFQEIISFYLNSYGENYKRSIIEKKIDFKGQEILTELNIRDRIKRTKLGYKSFCILSSYKIQKQAAHSAFLIAKKISGKVNIKEKKINYLHYNLINFFKKTRFFHYRGKRSWLTSSMIFNIIFILWCRISFLDELLIKILFYLEKKNFLSYIITDKDQYISLKKSLNEKL